jgi:hypothetical protein
MRKHLLHLYGVVDSLEYTTQLIGLSPPRLFRVRPLPGKPGVAILNAYGGVTQYRLIAL